MAGGYLRALKLWRTPSLYLSGEPWRACADMISSVGIGQRRENIQKWRGQ